MELILYTTKSPNNAVTKTLENADTRTGTLKDTTNIISPTLQIKSAEIVTCNYAYIPQFKRYYFVENIRSFRNGLCEIDLRIDVLMSYADEIKQSTGKAEVAVNNNPYFDGYTADKEVRQERTQLDFTNPFDEKGTFVLVAVNGKGV